MRAVVLLNRAGGTARRQGTDGHGLAATLATAGLDAEVREVAPADLATTARRLAEEGCGTVVAAGGDGTANAVAQGLVGTSTVLGVLPFGTFNHLARDLGLPRDTAKAARALANGERRAIDVGEVDGRVFLNSSALGFYPEVLAVRQDPRLAGRLTRALATLRAAVRVYPAFDLPTVSLVLDGRPLRRTTPGVFVGNNEAAMKLFTFGVRERLDEGVLQVSVLRGRRRGSVVRALLVSAVRDLRQMRLYDQWRVAEATVTLGGAMVPVFLDGELGRATPPLAYRTRPGALFVLSPATSSSPPTSPVLRA